MLDSIPNIPVHNLLKSPNQEHLSTEYGDLSMAFQSLIVSTLIRRISRSMIPLRTLPSKIRKDPRSKTRSTVKLLESEDNFLEDHVEDSRSIF